MTGFVGMEKMACPRRATGQYVRLEAAALAVQLTPASAPFLTPGDL
jgi:hypothetical protein